MIEREERRAHPRRAVQLSAIVAAGAEQPMAAAHTVDVSAGGLLLSFGELLGFPMGERILVSLDLDDGRFYAVGRIRRVERGDDFRTYVAVEFDEALHDGFDRLVAHIDGGETAADGPDHDG